MPSATHRHALPAGCQLGNYKIGRVLGVGGFGITYLGEHLSLGHPVAVKEYLPNEFATRDGATVRPKSATDQNSFDWGRARFLDEARMLTRFRHPNIVRVSDYFEANNTAYIVMDYEDSQPLDVLLEQHGTLTETQLRRVVLPVADGLRQVHAAGCLHRDIKPTNIFVRRADESPVLLDFGAARQALSGRSKSMTTIASAGYSPPEQYESDGKHGPWTDIYALSALCRRAITGETPLEATTRLNRMLHTKSDPLPDLADAGVPGYSRPLLAAVDHGLRLIEQERPQKINDWIALANSRTYAKKGGENINVGRVVSSRQKKQGAPKRIVKRVTVAVCMALCLALAFGGGKALQMALFYFAEDQLQDAADKASSEMAMLSCLRQFPQGVFGVARTTAEDLRRQGWSEGDALRHLSNILLENQPAILVPSIRRGLRDVVASAYNGMHLTKIGQDYCRREIPVIESALRTKLGPDASLDDIRAELL